MEYVQAAAFKNSREYMYTYIDHIFFYNIWYNIWYNILSSRRERNVYLQFM